MSLENNVAVVTGGSRDIGKAISLKLAARGAKVVVNYFNNAQQGADVVAEIEAAGGTAIAVAGDMTKSADVDGLVAANLAVKVANLVGGVLARHRDAVVTVLHAVALHHHHVVPGPDPAGVLR